MIEYAFCGAMAVAVMLPDIGKNDVLNPLLMLTYAYMNSVPENVNTATIEVPDHTVGEIDSHKNRECLKATLAEYEFCSEVDFVIEDEAFFYKTFNRSDCNVNNSLLVSHSINLSRGDCLEEDSSNSEGESSCDETEDSDHCTTVYSESVTATHSQSVFKKTKKDLSAKIKKIRQTCDCLGEGAYGSVYLIKKPHEQIDLDFVVKVRRPDSKQSKIEAFVELMDEARNLHRLRHENIVTLVYVETNKLRKQVILYLEHLPYSFEDVINEAEFLQGGGFLQGSGRLVCLQSAAEFGNMLLSLADVLIYLRSQGIVYFDTHSGNMMLSKKGTLKVIDFGLVSTVKKPVKIKIDGQYYLSPEIRAGGRITVTAQNS